MKEIKTKNFLKKEADLIEYPPVPGEEEDTMIKEKEWKRIGGRWVLVQKKDI